MARDQSPLWRWLAATTLLAGALGAVSAEETPRPPVAEDATEEAPQLPLWPLLENARLPDGSHRTMILGLWHRTTGPDGATRSWHVVNVLHWRDGHAVLPLWWRYGQPGAKTTIAAPLWAHGPGWTAAPLLLSGSWRRAEGGRTTWITPLFHRTTGANGRVQHAHALTALWGCERWAALPLAWGGQGRVSVLPMWFSGRDWWAAPPILSGQGRHLDGGRTTWITPLFHRTTRADGTLAHQHALIWLHAPGRHAVLPVWLSGRGWWMMPPLLTGSWRQRYGGRSTWIGPLAHARTDAQGRVMHAHLLTYIRIRDTHLVLPLAWYHHRSGAATAGVLPVWIQGHNWWVAPLLLSGGHHKPESSTLWLTPLFHHHRDAGGGDLHVLTWFSGRRGDSGYRALAPLLWHSWRGGQRRTAVIPAYFASERTRIIAPLLSGWRRHGDGGSSWWATPLAHRRVTADGAMRDLHVATWFSGRRTDDRSYQVLAPFYYRVAHRRESHLGVLPVWVSGPGYRLSPPLLTAWARRSQGGDALWVTPLFHRDRDAQGRTTSLHAGLWFQGRDWQLLVPVWYRRGAHWGVVPVYFRGRDWQVAPPVLSAWWRRRDGGDALWVTPLFHRDRDAAGRTAAWHLGPWFQSGDRRVLFPLFFAAGSGADRRFAVVPLLWKKREAWIAPPALSASWRQADGTRTTWLTPLAHWRRRPDGHIADLHALLWMQGRDWRALAPVWVAGRDWWAVPPLLSARLPRGDGGGTTWYTPLAHVGRDADGRITDFHALTWFHGRRYDVVFPLWWSLGRHRALVPVWFHGPRYDVVPPLLWARWRRADGGQSTWFTPLAHRSTAADGRVTDWHALNVIHAGTTTAVLPLAWWTGRPGHRHSVVLPIWFSGPRSLVVAPFFYSLHGGAQMGVVPFWFKGRDTWAAPVFLSAGWTRNGRSTTLITPLFHRSTRDGRTESLHALTWVQTANLRTAAPVYWEWWDTQQHRTLGVPLWYRRSGGGSSTTVVWPALFTHHRGAALSSSFALQCSPFLVQRAPHASEVNVLWRLFHRRAEGDTSEVMVGPLWSSEHRSGRPSRWSALLGIVSRRSNWQTGRYRYYLLWVVPLGGGRSAVPPSPAPVTATLSNATL